jgi:hypothetical protein
MNTPTVPAQPYSLVNTLDSIMEYNESQNSKLRVVRDDLEYEEINTELSALQSELQ